MKYLVSACLAGIKCRYNGESSYIPELAALVEAGEAVTFCPELLGGLPVPRTRCELFKNFSGLSSVISIDGVDYTAAFKKGARLSLEIAQKDGVTAAIMKSKSPSCGAGMVYDGSFTGRLVEGNGITAELFIKNGISILTEKEALSIICKRKEG